MFFVCLNVMKIYPSYPKRGACHVHISVHVVHNSVVRGSCAAYAGFSPQLFILSLLWLSSSGRTPLRFPLRRISKDAVFEADFGIMPRFVFRL